MIFATKKFVLSGLIVLFVCFTSCVISQVIDLGGWSLLNNSANPIHICDRATHTHEAFVTHHEEYDKYVEHCINNETKYYIANENIIYHNEPNVSDLNLSSHNINNNDSVISSYDFSNDSAIEAHRQTTEENQMAQIEAYNKPFPATGKIIYELSLPQGRTVYLRNIEGRTFDSTLIVEKTYTIKHLIAALQSPIIQARFQRIKYNYKSLHNPKKGRDHKSKDEMQLLDALVSGQITQILTKIMHSDLNIAQSGFDELKQLWPWKREHTFLGNSLKDGTGESGFNAKIGINVMKIAEKSLITRQDYIAKHANVQEQKTIQEYKEKCYLLQQKGNESALFDQKQQLYRCVIANGHKNDLMTNICLAIVENCLLDPITTIFRSIIYESSLEKACDHLKNLEKQLLFQAQQNGIIPMSEVRAWITNHYGFDVLDAAQNCYKSRVDYVYTPDSQSYLSDTIKPILHNIESKDLPTAHAELVHFEGQLIEGFKDQNITSPTAQKEYMVKFFGTNVLETALKKYTDRSDHKKLAESFIPLNVEKATITILENNNTYESVANEMNDLAKCVFVNARLCKLDFVENIENHIIDSLHVIKEPQNDAQFIFNVTAVDYLLTDIQQVSQGIVTGKPTLWERSPELFMRGLEKFFKGLYPITQVTNLCHLLKDTAIAGYYILDDTLDVTLHPNPMEQKNFFLKGQVCESLVNAARFTTDLIFGSSYLSTEEYLQRHAIFWKDYGSTITADNVVDLTAQILADFVYCKGIPSLFTFLKKIDAATKMEKQIAKVAETFKKAVDTRLAKNPSFITAEGITVQVSGAKIIEYMEATNANVKNVAAKVEKIVENTGTIAKMRGKQGSPYQKISKSTNTRPLDRLKGKDLIGIEDVSVSGYESLPKRVFLNNYEHYLQPELRTTTSGKIKPSGWHHDPGKNIERIKRVNGYTIEIEKYQRHSSGIYKFDWGIGAHKKTSTFFPYEWSRETVQKKIVEAYKYAKKNHCSPILQKNGTFAIYGFTQEGINIKIIVNIDGIVVTAYPIWPR